MQYVVPGYLLVCIIHAITQRKFSPASIWVWSSVLSFVSISFVNTITSNWDIHLQFWQMCIACIVLDVLLGIIISLAFCSNCFKQIAKKLFATTPIDETISNVIDWENGSNAVVYLKGEPSFFLGHVVTVGDGDGDGWICISAPIKYDADGKELYSHEDEKDTYLTIPLSETKYIKIVN